MNPEETVTEPQNPAEENKDAKPADDNKPDDDNKEEPKDKKPWFQKRFDRFTAQNQALAREKDALAQTNEQLLEEMANLRAGKTEDGRKSDLSEAEIEKRANQKALQIAAKKEFDKKCNVAHDNGIEEFDDFEESIKTLSSMGVMTNDFLDIVTDLDNSHKILHYLGQNPEEADRIQSLSPAKRIAALIKLEGKSDTKESKQISKVPPPIKPVEGKKLNTEGYATKYYEGMSQQEYNDWRDKTGRKK